MSYEGMKVEIVDGWWQQYAETGTIIRVDERDDVFPYLVRLDNSDFSHVWLRHEEVSALHADGNLSREEISIITTLLRRASFEEGYSLAYQQEFRDLADRLEGLNA